MKTEQELNERLMRELQIWFKRQCADNYSDFYLYHLPTTAEHIGGILIAKEKPANPEYVLSWPERINKSATIEQNYNYLRQHVIRTLPVLEID